MESTQDTTTTTNEKPKRTMSPELKEKLAIARRKALEAKKANKTNSQVEFSNPVPEPAPVAPVAPVPEAPVPEPVKKPRKPRSKKEPEPQPQPQPEPEPVAPVASVPDEPVKPTKQKSRKSKPLIIMEDSDSDESTDQQVIYIPRRKSSSRRKALPELPIPQAPAQQVPAPQAPAPAPVPVPQMPRVHRQPGMFYYTSSFM